MAEFLISLGKINLALCAAIFAVYILRRPVRAAFHAQTAYGLWLLVPVAAFASLLPPRTLPAGPIGEAMVLVGTGALQPMLPGPISASLDWTLVLFAAWLAGSCAMALYLMWLQLKFHAAERAGLAGPAVAGFFRPRLVVPADFVTQFSAREQAAILAHEHAHLARQDARINALMASLRCLCWFNPVIHLGSVWLRRDQELACDVAAVREVSRPDYAKALLKSQMPAMPLPLGCAWPGSEHPLTERVALLKHAPPKPARRLTGVLLIALSIAIGGLCVWAVQPPIAGVAQAQTNPDLRDARFAIRAVDENVRENAGLAPVGDDRLTIASPGTTTVMWFNREGQINADALADAKAGIDKNGKNTIEIRLTPKGRDQFAALTRANVGHRIALIVKTRVINVTTVSEPILGGQITLTGVTSTNAEAEALAAEMMGTNDLVRRPILCATTRPSFPMMVPLCESSKPLWATPE